MSLNRDFRLFVRSLPFLKPASRWELTVREIAAKVGLDPRDPGSLRRIQEVVSVYYAILGSALQPIDLVSEDALAKYDFREMEVSFASSTRPWASIDQQLATTPAREVFLANADQILATLPLLRRDLNAPNKMAYYYGISRQLAEMFKFAEHLLAVTVRHLRTWSVQKGEQSVADFMRLIIATRIRRAQG